MIYFDCAATSLKRPECISKALMEALDHFGNAGRGTFGPPMEAARSIFRGRQLLAKLIGAESPERIAFTSGTTEGLNIAIKGLISPGDHVITTLSEHNSVLRPLYEMEAMGCSLSYIGLDEAGRLIMPDALLRSETKAIVLQHGSNVTGQIHDIRRIARWAHAHGLLVIVDGAQTVGVIPINVQEMEIDVLCFSGHKGLMGLQGTGAIYVREGLNIPPLKTGGSGIRSFEKHHPESMPEALEAGTLPGQGIAAMAAGTKWILDQGVDKIYEKEMALTYRFLDGIVNIPGIKIYGLPETGSYTREAILETCRHLPIVSLNIEDMDAAQLCDLLAEDYGIITRGGAHCAPLVHQHFHTEDQGMVRFSFSCFNTEDEVDMAIRAIRSST